MFIVVYFMLDFSPPLILKLLGALGLLLVEVALVISSSENRRLGDRIAGTVVISRSTSQEN